MLDLTALAEPSVLVPAVGAACTAVGAGTMRLVSAWENRRREDAQVKLSSAQQQAQAEDLMREDLLQQNRELRDEIKQMRVELAEARRELREFGTMHQTTIADWQKRYGDLLAEVAQLRAVVTARAIQG